MQGAGGVSAPGGSGGEDRRAPPAAFPAGGADGSTPDDRHEAQRQRALLAAIAAPGAEAAGLGLREQGARAQAGLAAYRANLVAVAQRALGAAFPTLAAMLGILTETGYPTEHAGILAVPTTELGKSGELKTLPGKKCPECGNKALIRKDGCDFCTDCGHTGACG